MACNSCSLASGGGGGGALNAGSSTWSSIQQVEHVEQEHELQVLEQQVNHVQVQSVSFSWRWRCKWSICGNNS